jgi:lipopolysaccharide transport system ATP-binding protein
MSSQPVIVASGLTKAYRIWSDPAQRLLGPLLAESANLLPGAIGEALRRKAHAAYRDFHALQDVSFEVRRGEAVGIVGRNGAGKSTLLQLIAGTLQPTSGTIEVRGRVAALLELGAGFNPDFTGRENVFLSGAVLGLSKAEMEARFEEVAAFADIGDFIEQPVKTYSSGMMMRLAFAVNTCVDPEILIVDEALSVGDAPFQAKCFRRLRQLTEKGVSLLFVSHDLGTVRSICSRALWLKQGRTEIWGEAKEVSREYEKFCWREQGVVTDAASGSPPEPTDRASEPLVSARSTGFAMPSGEVPAPMAPPSSPPASLFTAPLLQHDASARYGTGAVRIERLLLTDEHGEPKSRFEFNEVAVLHYLLQTHSAIDSDIVIGVRIKDTKDNFLLSTQDIVSQHRMTAPAGARYYAVTRFRLPLTHDKFLIKTGIFGFNDGESRPGGQYDYSRAVLWDIIEDGPSFAVAVCPSMPLVGPVHAHSNLILQPLAAHPNPSQT